MEMLLDDIEQMVSAHIGHFFPTRNAHQFAFDLKDRCPVSGLDAEGVTCQG